MLPLQQNQKSPDKKSPAKTTQPEPLYASNKKTHFIPVSEVLDESLESCTFTNPEFPDFVMVEVPSVEELTEFFPLSHVILNNVDCSLTVTNDGLCVMIYSFQPSKAVTAIKVCTALLH